LEKDENRQKKKMKKTKKEKGRKWNGAGKKGAANGRI
jgi:hypothetical protein